MPLDGNFMVAGPPQEDQNKQENNDLLLNAIKNKFAAKNATQNHTSASFSPPKFNIPLLKPSSGADSSAPAASSARTTAMGGFVLPQLQSPRNATTTTTTGGFVLPQLQVPQNTTATTNDTVQQTASKPSFIIPMLKDLHISKHNSNNPENESQPSVIDLSSALSNSPSQQPFKPSNRQHTQNAQPFHTDAEALIIFTDCLPSRNHYGLASVPGSYGEPSAFARVICHNMKCIHTEKVPPRPTHKVKHEIKPFQFDTKSPDDMVTLTRLKYQRQSHT